VYGVAVDSDDKIIVIAAQVNNPTSYENLLWRFDIDGRLDSSFSGDGKVDGGDVANAHCGPFLQPDDKVLFEHGRKLGRLTNAGVLDLSFGDRGEAWLTGYEPQWCKAQLQRDGGILIAGFDTIGQRSKMAVWRLLPDGINDRRFADHGVRVIEPEENEKRYPEDAIHLWQSPAGTIYGVGFVDVWSDHIKELKLFRLTSDGNVDAAFGANGSLVDSDSPWSSIKAAAFVDRHRLLVFGTAPNNAGFKINRYWY